MITEKRELKNVPLADLIPYARNPRKNDPAVQRVAASLKEYGLVKNSIVVDEDMVLITGHTTTKAMQALKWATAPEVTQVFGLTEAQKKAYRIADNKLGELAAWDEELLALEFEDLKGLDFDLDQTGFDDKELGKILGAGKEASEDDYEPPAVIETDIQRGDLFRLGRHRLLCGDSTSAEDVARLMDGKKADMVFTDPPYGVDYTGGTVVRERLCGDATPDLYLPSLKLIHATTIDKVAIYLWYSDSKSNAVFAAVSAAGFEQRCVIIWNKNNAQFGALGAQYHTKHEPALYLFKKGKSPNWYGPTNETTVWDCQRSNANKMHPTQKPVELAIRAINNSSKKGDLILDLFLGSGTTLIAAEQLGRTCYGMEISPQYCQVIIDRWEKLTGQKAEKIDGD